MLIYIEQVGLIYKIGPSIPMKFKDINTNTYKIAPSLSK